MLSAGSVCWGCSLELKILEAGEDPAWGRWARSGHRGLSRGEKATQTAPHTLIRKSSAGEGYCVVMQMGFWRREKWEGGGQIWGRGEL